MAFRVLARHKWVAGATITESYNEATDERRFTASILGWTNWKIAKAGKGKHVNPALVALKVRNIRDRIEAGDEDVFREKNKWRIVR